MGTGRLCCVIACPNSSRATRSVDARYFDTPRSPYYGDKWRAWILNENYPACKNVKRSYLCHRHFNQSCFLPNGKLATGSVPSIGHAPGRSPPSSVLEQNEGKQESKPESITLEDMLRSSEPVLQSNFASRPPLYSGQAQCHLQNTSSGLISHSISSLFGDTSSLSKGAEMLSSGKTVSESDISKEIKCKTSEGHLGNSSFMCINIKQESCENTMQLSRDSDVGDYKHEKGKDSPLPLLHEAVSDPHSMTFASVTPPLSVRGEGIKISEVYSIQALPHSISLDQSSSPLTSGNSTHETHVKAVHSKHKSPAKRYFGDLCPSDFSSPIKAEQYLSLTKMTINSLRRKLKIERNKCYRLQAKVKSLESLLKHLRRDEQHFACD